MTPEVANPVNKHTQPELSKTRRASWIPNLGLMTDDLDLINRGEWLNDRVVDAINKVVATNLCLDITQTTLLSQAATGFKPNTHESMQIIHGYNHWIATACLGDEVLVADSMSQDISEYVARQIKKLHKNQLVDNRLKVTLKQCTQQRNGNDCGVYAAAFMFEWATMTPDLSADFDTKRMRKHLVSCLEKGVATPFPRVRASAKKSLHNLSSEKVIII